MTTNVRAWVLPILAVVGLGECARADQTWDFNSPVALSNTPSPGVWFTDRYNPAGFQSPVSFLGDNRLKESIAASDYQSTGFYNTQGRGYLLDPQSVAVSIQVYLDPAWKQTSLSSTDIRYAGLWAAGTDGVNPGVSNYPIIEIATPSNTTGASIRVWDSETGWFPVTWHIEDGDFGEFQTISFALDGSNLDYFYNGTLLASVSATGTVSLNEVMLQAYNRGTSYDVYWDNLNVTAVPEPSTLVLSGLGIAGLAAVRVARRRKASNAA